MRDDLEAGMSSLSASGALRQQQMRAALVAGVGRRRRLRRAARVSLAASLFAVVAWGWNASRAPVVELPHAHLPDAFAVRVVHDDPGIVARVRIVAVPATQWLDDEHLLASLRDCGRPAGVVRVGAQVWAPGLAVDTWE